MALVVSNSPNNGVADPTSSLKVALVEFENILSADQKKRYHATSNALDTSTVISFAKTLDESRQGAAQRGVSSRLITFLDSLQRFTQIVDTFVSSNPKIAALVWGGAKTAILAANNISSYFDKVTAMIMNIGKIYPTYQSFGHLYSGCVELQNALCEYYAAVIRLCMKIVIVSQRSGLLHTLSSAFYSFESEFSANIAELHQATDFVKLQCALASKKATAEAEKLAAVDRRENDKYRHLGKIFQSFVTKDLAEAREWRLRQLQRETSQMRDTVCDSMSTINSLRLWKRVLQQRIPSTAEWFQEDATFNSWRNDNDSAIIWCVGTMGVGKTVLMSSIVEYLHISRAPSETISHHFCMSDDEASLKARNILGSIARQILNPWIQNIHKAELRDLCQATSNANSAEIVDLLSSRMQPNHIHNIVVDGVDECKVEEIEELMLGLASLYKRHSKNIKVVFASRPDQEKVFRRKLNIKYRLPVTEANTRGDIACYINTALDQRLDNGKLKLSNSDLIQDISETLERGAQGMFLWIRLFIDDLCEQQSDNDILEILKNPSPSIFELIRRTIGRIESRRSAKNVMRLLRYCGVTKRPLTTDEFRELLSVEVGQKFLDIGQMVHDVGEVVGDTGGLMYVDEEEETIHYVHHSIRSYLFNPDQERDDFRETQIDLHLGFLSMTYLNYDDFKRGMVRSRPDLKSESSMAIPPMGLGVASISASSSTATRIAQKLLQNRRLQQPNSRKDLERMVRDVGSANHPVTKQELQYRFMDYAKSHWLDHLREMTPDSDFRMWQLFHELVNSKNGLIDTPWTAGLGFSSATVDLHNQIVRWALDHDKLGLLMHEVIYEIDAISENSQLEILERGGPKTQHYLMRWILQDRHLGTAGLHEVLLKSAFLGLVDCVDLYIQHGFATDMIDHALMLKVLQVAAGEGHLEVVERLIKAGANVNGRDKYGVSALQLASERGHLEVVERLIEAGADVNSRGKSGGWNPLPLPLASWGGHHKVAQRLIEAGAKRD